MGGWEYRKTPSKTVKSVWDRLTGAQLKGIGGDGREKWYSQGRKQRKYKVDVIWSLIYLAVLFKIILFFLRNKISKSCMNVWQFYIIFISSANYKTKYTLVINSFFPSSYQILNYAWDTTCMITFRLPPNIAGVLHFSEFGPREKLGREKFFFAINQRPAFLHPKRNDRLRERDWKNKSEVSFSPQTFAWPKS